MKIGIRCHDIKRASSVELVEVVNHYGFDSVQLVLKKAIKEIDFKKVELTSTLAKEISDYFKNTNIAMLGAYFNPVHENKEKVQNDIDYFKKCLKYASIFNTKYVGTETGSYNNEPWIYHPKNQTEEGYLEAKKVIEELVRYAEEVDSCVAIEGAYGHIMYKPRILKRLYDEINSNNMKIIVDIYNYLYIGNYGNAEAILDECLELFHDNIIIFHIKDFIVENNSLKQVAIGKGIMPLNKMLKKMKEKCPNATLIFEGSIEEDLDYSMKFVKGCLGE